MATQKLEAPEIHSGVMLSLYVYTRLSINTKEERGTLKYILTYGGRSFDW